VSRWLEDVGVYYPPEAFFSDCGFDNPHSLIAVPELLTGKGRRNQSGFLEEENFRPPGARQKNVIPALNFYRAGFCARIGWFAGVDRRSSMTGTLAVQFCRRGWEKNGNK